MHEECFDQHWVNRKHWKVETQEIVQEECLDQSGANRARKPQGMHEAKQTMLKVLYAGNTAGYTASLVRAVRPRPH